MAEFLHIPGNIKQEFIPFLLDPAAKINQHTETSQTLKGAAPQYFTYKTNKKSLGGGIGYLGLFPSSFSDINLKKDLSYKMLYGRNDDGSINSGGQVTLGDLLNAFPSVQIREYTPDARLDQVFNFFSNLFKKVEEVKGQENKESGDAKSATGQATSAQTTNSAGFFEKIAGVMEFMWKWIIGSIDPNLLKELGDKIGEEAPLPGYGSAKASGHGLYVLKIPAMLYCGIQDCTTTNLYELPAMLKDNKLLESNGTAGWGGSGSGTARLGGFSKLLGDGHIGKIVNSLLGNIGMHYMPYWNAESGSSGDGETVSIEVDLVNDSPTTAMANFIFVNTIVPNNRWIQYHFFQHSPALYDVKIEGINRLFVCSGQFDVSYVGVLRDPPNQFLTDLGKMHVNKNVMSGEFASSLMTEKLIKIPDAYHVSMTFHSLLPANFNTMMMAYAQNNNIVNDSSKFGFTEGFSTKFSGILNDFGGNIVDVWKNGGDYTSSGFKDL